MFRIQRLTRCSPSLIRKTFATIPRGQLDVSGVFPPLTTPFNKNGDIMYDHLKENIRKFNAIPFKGYAVHGSNGEYVFLTNAEKLKILEKVKEVASGEKIIIAGAGCESTDSTIETTKSMSVFADAAMVVTPSYFKPQMNEAALISHYTKVADESPIPIILYSIPRYTNIDIPLDVIEALSHHENIIGLKESSGNISKIGEIYTRTQSSGFQILAGSASYFLPALLYGSVGSVCALGNVLGDQVCQVYDLYKKRDIEKANELQKRLVPVNMAVTSQYGVAGLKKIMDQMGYFGGVPRLPMQPLDDESTTQLCKIFAPFMKNKQ